MTKNCEILITLLQVNLIDISRYKYYFLVYFLKSTETLVTYLHLFSLGMDKSNMWQLS